MTPRLDPSRGVPADSAADSTAAADATVDAVVALADRLEREDGAPPLSDQARTRLRAADVEHFVVRDGDAVTGYGQRDGDELELAAEPDAAELILDALTGPVSVWSHGSGSRLAAVFERRGLHRVRELLQLRRPADEPLPADPPLSDGVAVRAFVPGRDEAAWLAVNAAAFADHPEQGRQTRDDLLAREAEDWFDADGFLLAESSGEPLGFHWTKLHPDGGGEVYVLGISPAAQGLGLGKALLVRGLRRLVENGCGYLLLYVEADNTGARGLYERLGFTRFDVDVQWQAR